MRKLPILCGLLLLSGFAFGQTPVLNRIRLAESLDGYIYLLMYNTTVNEAEFIQGFPASQFDNIKTLDGVYAGMYDEYPATTEKFEIIIRQSDATGKKPDMQAKPIYTQAGVTQAGGTTGAWVSEKVIFPKPVALPPGTIWIGVKVDKQRTATDFLRYGGQNKRGVGTACFGVDPRPGVTNEWAFYSQYANGAPGPLLQTDYAWVWNTGLLLQKPVLQAYSVCAIDRGGPAPHVAPKDTNDYAYGGIFPDLVNATNYPAPGRYDKIGWRIMQANYTTGNVQWGFIFLSDRKLPVALPTPFGHWTILYGGPLWPLGPLFSPLTNGKWETTPLPIPMEVRRYLLGKSIFAQAAVAELDKSLTILNVEFSNMAGMHP